MGTDLAADITDAAAAVEHRAQLLAHGVCAPWYPSIVCRCRKHQGCAPDVRHRLLLPRPPVSLSVSLTSVSYICLLSLFLIAIYNLCFLYLFVSASCLFLLVLFLISVSYSVSDICFLSLSLVSFSCLCLLSLFLVSVSYLFLICFFLSPSPISVSIAGHSMR